MKVEINNNTLNKTWQELYEAAITGTILYVENSGNKAYLMNFYDGTEDGEECSVAIVYGDDYEWYIANSASDYPVLESPPDTGGEIENLA